MKMNTRLMAFLARIFKEEASPKKTSKILPFFRLPMGILTILLCAMSKNSAFAVTVIAAELLRLSLRSAGTIAGVLKEVFIAVLFSLLILLPSVFMGSPRTMLTVAMKVFESVLVLGILNADICWKDMTAALGDLHFPQIFIFTLDSTVRFLTLLGRLSDAMLEAITLRSVGKDNWKTKGTGGVLGTAFLKSESLSEETARAMACRCFDGRYLSFSPRKPALFDYLYLALAPLLAFGFIMTEGMMR